MCIHVGGGGCDVWCLSLCVHCGVCACSMCACMKRALWGPISIKSRPIGALYLASAVLSCSYFGTAFVMFLCELGWL